jgi:hypothetical protein
MDEGGLQKAFSCAPVLTYQQVGSAPMLEKSHFRLTLIHPALRLGKNKKAASRGGFCFAVTR